MSIHLMEDTIVLPFGEGKALLGTGTTKAGAFVGIEYTEEVHEIGPLPEDKKHTKAGLPEIMLHFTKTESIDAMIDCLEEAKKLLK